MCRKGEWISQTDVTADFGNNFEFKLPTIFHGKSAKLSLLVKSFSLVVHRSHLGIVFECKAIFFVIIKRQNSVQMHLKYFATR